MGQKHIIRRNYSCRKEEELLESGRIPDRCVIFGVTAPKRANIGLVSLAWLTAPADGGASVSLASRQSSSSLDTAASTKEKTTGAEGPGAETESIYSLLGIHGACGVRRVCFPLSSFLFSLRGEETMTRPSGPGQTQGRGGMLLLCLFSLHSHTAALTASHRLCVCTDPHFTDITLPKSKDKSLPLFFSLPAPLREEENKMAAQVRQ